MPVHSTKTFITERLKRKGNANPTRPKIHDVEENRVVVHSGFFAGVSKPAFVSSEVHARMWDAMTTSLYPTIIAPTGSGKTFFWIQLVEAISKSKQPDMADVRLLFTCPLQANLSIMLKELEEHVDKNMITTSFGTNAKLGLDRSRDPIIHLSTPESFNQVLIRDSILERWKDRRILCIADEADLFFQWSTFRPSMETFVAEVMNRRIPMVLQTATMSTTTYMSMRATPSFSKYQICAIGDRGSLARSDVDFKFVELHTNQSIPVFESRVASIKSVLSAEPGKVKRFLVVVRQMFDKHGSDEHKAVKRLQEELSAFCRVSVYHSKTDDSEKMTLIRKLEAGEIDGIICTSALHRGNFKSVEHVVFAEMPQSPEEFFQFAGRVNRGANRATSRGQVTVIFHQQDAVIIQRLNSNKASDSARQLQKSISELMGGSQCLLRGLHALETGEDSTKDCMSCPKCEIKPRVDCAQASRYFRTVLEFTNTQEFRILDLSKEADVASWISGTKKKDVSFTRKVSTYSSDAAMRYGCGRSILSEVNWKSILSIMKELHLIDGKHVPTKEGLAWSKSNCTKSGTTTFQHHYQLLSEVKKSSCSRCCKTQKSFALGAAHPSKPSFG